MKYITSAEEFQKNSELKEQDLKYMKEWLSKQDHLPKDISDELLILLMHSCYYSLEASKVTIDNYFTMRSHIPEFFINRNTAEPTIKEAMKTSFMIPLKGRTSEGYRVIYCGLKRFEASQYIFADSMKLFNMVLDAWNNAEGTASGLVIVLDMNGVSFGHVARLTLSVMKKILVYLQEGMPVRLKGFHYINVVPFIDAIMALMKPFMKKELIDVLQFHTEGLDSLYEFIPKEILPNTSGGKAGATEQLWDETTEFLQQYNEWYKEDEKMRVDESRRQGKAKNASDLFGVEGSFRKLNID